MREPEFCRCKSALDEPNKELPRWLNESQASLESFSDIFVHLYQIPPYARRFGGQQFIRTTKAFVI
jgi:hypothetical protein